MSTKRPRVIWVLETRNTNINGPWETDLSAVCERKKDVNPYLRFEGVNFRVVKYIRASTVKPAQS